MTFVGVDGCRAGWFTVKFVDSSNWEINIFRSIRSLWNNCKESNLILIDMPIGLIEEGSHERVCDKEARRLLGRKRGSSIFPVPCRSAVYTDINEASKVNYEHTGRKLSRQALGILPKIRQVDQLLNSNNVTRLRIRETHPELYFWALNDRNPMVFSKKDRRGIRERKKILFSLDPKYELIFKYAEQAYRRKDVARDDILDALAAAVTASKGEKSLVSIPARPEIDSKGLPMEILF
jgi:predicted RNase H-like nuclease